MRIPKQTSGLTAGLFSPASLLALALLAGCGGGGGAPAGASSVPTSTSTPPPAAAADPAPAAAPAATVSASDAAVQAAKPGNGTYTWTSALFGGGGFVSGITYHPTVQGLVYIRTDVGGMYRRDPGSTTWIPLNEGLGFTDGQLLGPASIALDPNDSQKLYSAAGQYLPSWGRNAAILRSSDRGATWSRTELTIHLNGNSDGRGSGERLQVDPNKGSILFLGTNQDGLYKSTDSGVTWSQVPGFPTTAGTTFLRFDKSTGSLGTATNTIYVGVATTTGPALYRSTDAGTTWASVSGGPAGLMPLQGALDGNGHLLMSYANALGPSGATAGGVYKLTLATNTWTDITPVAPTSSWTFGYGGLAVDPRNANSIVVTTLDRWGGGDDLFRSTDGGATWTPLNAISTHAAPNNPWVAAFYGGSLAGKMGHWITDVDIDPFNSNNVMYNTGYGLWESNNLGSGAVAWSFNVSGIEETGLYSPLVSPSTGAHLFSNLGDVSGARYDTNFASVSGYYSNPNNSNYSVDVAALNTNVVARTTASGNGLMLSQDNGVTWTASPTSPVASTSSDSGRIAVSANGDTLLWVPGSQSAYYSTNNGASWTASTGYTVSQSVWSGQYLAPVADKVANNYFYSYDMTQGVIRESANGGQSFSTIYSGLDILPSYASQNQLASVPGTVRRDLWLATPNGLWHINGAAASPVKITGVQICYGVGFGMAATGKTYPAVYITGKINDVYGVFQSIDAGATWKRINDDAHQWGGASYITGDMRVFGRVYLGPSRGGVVIGNVQ